MANHYRWIVWKLACYERRLPQQLAGRMLTAPVVLNQLKYRCCIVAKASALATRTAVYVMNTKAAVVPPGHSCSPLFIAFDVLLCNS